MADLPTLDVFRQHGADDAPLVVVTAYDVPSARVAAAAGVDALLVGDSLGQVLLGHETTLTVTLDEMLHHARAVVRAQTGLPVIVDLPYGTFHVDPRQTARAGLRIVQEAGAHAVKLEGGRVRAAHIEALLAAEIPVMGHLGLTPQSVNVLGGYRVQGRAEAAAEQLLEEARFLAGAGVFAIVLECVPASVARRITRAVDVPTIGIGAGVDCTGQVLVQHDLLGLAGDFAPRFVKRYAELGADATAALAAWARDVRAGAFPTAAHSFGEGKKRSSAASSGAGYLGGVREEENE